MDDPDSVPTFDDYLLSRSILTDGRRGLNVSTLAIPDGATGLGLALVEMSARSGPMIIAGAHDAAEEARLRASGATHIIRRDATDFAAEVMRLTEGRGAELIVDQVAGPGFAGLFEMIADFGNLFVTGWRGGDAPKLFETLWAALDRCPCVQLWTLDRYRADPSRLAALQQEVAAFLEPQSLRGAQIGA